jgi:hypothetical protein
MTSTRERLEALDQADFDTFGEQDKGIGEHPLATPEEVKAISEAFYDHPWEDPTRYQDGFAIMFGVMGSIAVAGGTREWSEQEATQALRRVMARVVRGEMQAEVDRR